MSIRIDGTNTAANPGITGADTDTGLQFGTNEVSIVTDGTAQVKVDNEGKVSIGNTSADQKLHLEDSGSNVYLRVTETGNTGIDFGQATNGNGVINLRDDADIQILTNGTEQVRLDSSGRLLAGTTSNSGNYRAVFEGNAGNSAAGGDVLLARGAATPANSQALGLVGFSDNTHTISAQVQGVRDGGTWSGSSKPTRMIFSTCADGDTSLQERVRIGSDGLFSIKNSFSDSARNTVIQIECGGQGRGRILSGNSDTDAASFGAGSDRRLKTNIRNYTGGLERIRQIPVKIYDEVNSGATGVISWVADEVAPIFPEAVIGEADAVDADGNPEYQILSSLKFFPDLVQCVQTLIAKVETLETQNTAQQAQIDDLLARVTALEATE